MPCYTVTMSRDNGYEPDIDALHEELCEDYEKWCEDNEVMPTKDGFTIWLDERYN